MNKAVAPSKREICEYLEQKAKMVSKGEIESPDLPGMIADGYIFAIQQLRAIEQYALIKKGTATSPGRKKDWEKVIDAARAVIGEPND